MSNEDKKLEIVIEKRNNDVRMLLRARDEKGSTFLRNKKEIISKDKEADMEPISCSRLQKLLHSRNRRLLNL